MTVVAQVEQGPVVAIATQDHAPAIPAVSAVRTSFRHVFGAMHVGRSSTALTRATIDLDVVYEIGFHSFLFKQSYRFV